MAAGPGGVGDFMKEGPAPDCCCCCCCCCWSWVLGEREGEGDKYNFSPAAFPNPPGLQIPSFPPPPCSPLLAAGWGSSGAAGAAGRHWRSRCSTPSPGEEGGGELVLDCTRGGLGEGGRPNKGKREGGS